MKKSLVLASLALTITGAFAASSAFENALQQARESNKAKNFVAAHKSLDVAMAAAKTPEEKAHVLLGQGSVYNDEKNPAKAREMWQQVLDLKGATNEEKWVVLTGIAVSFADEKRFAEARAALSQIVSNPLAPVDLKATSRMEIAEIYGEEGQSDPARQGQLEVARTEYLKIGADAKVPLFWRFASQMRAGDMGIAQSKWPQARDDYDKAARLPELDVMSKSSAIGHVVETFYSEGNEAQAQAVAIPVKNDLLEEATKFFDDGKWLQARAYYSAVLLVSGSHEEPLATATWSRQIAQCYLGEGNLEQAAKELDEVSKLLAQIKEQEKGADPKELDPERAQALRLAEQATAASIAALHSKQGHKEQARQDYQKILQMPDLDPTIRKGVQEFLDKTK